MKQVLIVCTANICRSPTAEALLRARSVDGGGAVDHPFANALLRGQLVDGLMVSSAGTSALIGHALDEGMAAILAERGIDCASHRARQLTREDLRAADLVLAMQHHHLHFIRQLDPAARGKSFLLGHWLDQLEIADPFQQERALYERAISEIEAALAAWMPKLRLL